MYFSFNFVWYSIKFDIVYLEQGMGYLIPSRQNLLSVTQKLFADDLLNTDHEYDGLIDSKQACVFTISMNSFIFCTFFHLPFLRIHYIPNFFLKKMAPIHSCPPCNIHV